MFHFFLLYAIPAKTTNFFLLRCNFFFLQKKNSTHLLALLFVNIQIHYSEWAITRILVFSMLGPPKSAVQVYFAVF